jgi:hypothetical protein
LRCLRGDTGCHRDGSLSVEPVVPAAPQMFAVIWRHRIIDSVTSPGAVRFAPLRSHSGMPRLFTATASPAMAEPRSKLPVWATLSQDPLRLSAERATPTIDPGSDAVP